MGLKKFEDMTYEEQYKFIKDAIFDEKYNNASTRVYLLNHLLENNIVIHAYMCITIMPLYLNEGCNFGIKYNLKDYPKEKAFDDFIKRLGEEGIMKKKEENKTLKDYTLEEFKELDYDIQFNLINLDNNCESLSKDNKFKIFHFGGEWGLDIYPKVIIYHGDKNNTLEDVIKALQVRGIMKYNEKHEYGWDLYGTYKSYTDNTFILKPYVSMKFKDYGYCMWCHPSNPRNHCKITNKDCCEKTCPRTKAKMDKYFKRKEIKDKYREENKRIDEYINRIKVFNITSYRCEVHGGPITTYIIKFESKLLNYEQRFCVVHNIKRFEQFLDARVKKYKESQKTYDNMRKEVQYKYDLHKLSQKVFNDKWNLKPFKWNLNQCPTIDPEKANPILIMGSRGMGRSTNKIYSKQVDKNTSVIDETVELVKKVLHKEEENKKMSPLLTKESIWIDPANCDPIWRTSISTSAVTNEPDLPKCKICGKQLRDPEGNFCSHCGERVTPEEKPENEINLLKQSIKEWEDMEKENKKKRDDFLKEWVKDFEPFDEYIKLKDVCETKLKGKYFINIEYKTIDIMEDKWNYTNLETRLKIDETGIVTYNDDVCKFVMEHADELKLGIFKYIYKKKTGKDW